MEIYDALKLVLITTWVVGFIYSLAWVHGVMYSIGRMRKSPDKTIVRFQPIGILIAAAWPVTGYNLWVDGRRQIQSHLIWLVSEVQKDINKEIMDYVEERKVQEGQG